MELKLLKMGLGADGQTASVTPAPAATSPGWADEGWTIRTGNGHGNKKKKK